MLITKGQQEALIANYNKEGHSQDECLGFIDGIGKLMELILRLDNPMKRNNGIKPISIGVKCAVNDGGGYRECIVSRVDEETYDTTIGGKKYISNIPKSTWEPIL